MKAFLLNLQALCHWRGSRACFPLLVQSLPRRLLGWAPKRFLNPLLWLLAQNKPYDNFCLKNRSSVGLIDSWRIKLNEVFIVPYLVPHTLRFQKMASIRQVAASAPLWVVLLVEVSVLSLNLESENFSVPSLTAAFWLPHLREVTSLSLESFLFEIIALENKAQLQWCKDSGKAEMGEKGRGRGSSKGSSIQICTI